MRLVSNATVILSLAIPGLACAPAVSPALQSTANVANPEIATNPEEIPTSKEPTALPEVIDLVRDKPSTEDRDGARYLITYYGKTRMCFYSNQFRDSVDRYADDKKSFELRVADDDKPLLEPPGPAPIRAELKVLGGLPNAQSSGARLYLCFQSSEPLITPRSKWLELRAIVRGEKKPWDDTRVLFRLVDVAAQKAEDRKNAPPGQVQRTRSF